MLINVQVVGLQGYLFDLKALNWLKADLQSLAATEEMSSTESGTLLISIE